MKALDEAVYGGLTAAGAPWQPGQVYRGLPPVDTPPPYLLYGQSDSRRGGRNSFSEEHRLYEYTVVAVSYDADEAEAWREAVEAALLDVALDVGDGWAMTERTVWNGETPYAGRIETDGRILATAGVRLALGVQRPRLRG